MGLLLKTLSILSGSNENTLLNCRAELSNKFGSAKLSSESEKMYIFEILENDLPNIAKQVIPKIMTREDADKLELNDLVTITFDYYNHSKKHELLKIISRVMIHFYNLTPGNIESLQESLMLLTTDFANFMQGRR